MKRKVYTELIAVINAVHAGVPVEGIDDWREITELAKRNGLISYVYEGTKGNRSVDARLMQMIRNCYFTGIGLQTRQEHYAGELFGELKRRGIRYLPLRGYVLRRLYPSPGLRLSGNLDLFCREESLPEVEEILHGYGFVRTMAQAGRYRYELDRVSILIRTRLTVRPDVEGETDVWEKRLVDVDGIEYRFTPEDGYLYQIGQMYSQMTDDGIGIRSLLDLEQVLRAYPDRDGAYIDTQLRRLGLLTFARSMEKLAGIWYRGLPTDDDALLLGKYVAAFHSPEAAELQYVSENATRSKRERRRYKNRLVFLPYRVMKREYPVLRRAAVLLPLFWLFRLFRVVFLRGSAEQSDAAYRVASRRTREMAARIQRITGLDEEPDATLPLPEPVAEPAR